MESGRFVLLALILMTSACDKLEQTASEQVDLSSEAAPVITAQEIAGELTAKNNGRAAELARQAVQTNPNDPSLFFLLARSEALLRNTGSATGALQNAFNRGYDDPRSALAHSDFDGIRATPEFQNLVAKYGPGGTNSSALAPAGPITTNSIAPARVAPERRLPEARNFNGSSCSQLWFARNEIFARNGYCFKTPRAIDAFGTGCFPPYGRLGASDTRDVAQIKASETAMGCPAG
jgi:YARHG domain